MSRYRIFFDNKMYTPEDSCIGVGSGSIRLSIGLNGKVEANNAFDMGWYAGVEYPDLSSAITMLSLDHRDSEDNEIFEGDIIDIGQTVNGQSRFIIYSALCKLDIRYAYDINIKYEYDALDLLTCEELKIVGNIHQK